MSAREILDTTEALLRDSALGLTATVERFAAAHPEITGDPGPLSADFNFLPWTLTGEQHPTHQGGNVMLAPVEWDGGIRMYGSTQRDASASVEIGYEYFSASLRDIQTQLTLVKSALLQVLDQLVEYAAGNGGTIYEVDRVYFRFAQYPGPTAGGWIATVTLRERSLND